MEKCNPLTKEQIDTINNGGMVKGSKIVRFMVDGQAVCITSGQACSKGCNVIHQIMYWDKSMYFANTVKDALKVNNMNSRVRVVVS